MINNKMFKMNVIKDLIKSILDPYNLTEKINKLNEYMDKLEQENPDATIIDVSKYLGKIISEKIQRYLEWKRQNS